MSAREGLLGVYYVMNSIYSTAGHQSVSKRKQDVVLCNADNAGLRMFYKLNYLKV